MPHTTASWVQTKTEVALASHWIWHFHWKSLNCTTFKVPVHSSPPGLSECYLPEISPSVSITFPRLLTFLAGWQATEGAASPANTFHFQISLSSILQRPHPLALMLLKLEYFQNHFKVLGFAVLNLIYLLTLSDSLELSDMLQQHDKKLNKPQYKHQHW